MKKNYVAPVAEKIKFEYKDQVVATSTNCQNKYGNVGTTTCENEDLENKLLD